MLDLLNDVLFLGSFFSKDESLLPLNLLTRTVVSLLIEWSAGVVPQREEDLQTSPEMNHHYLSS